MGKKEWFQVCSPQMQSHKFICTLILGSGPPTWRIVNTCLPLEESMMFFGLWWDSHLSKNHISMLKTQCKEALNLIWVVAHLKWGGARDTLLMLYWAVVRSKLEYGCIVYGTASNTNPWQLDSIHNSGLRLALSAFCTSSVSSLYTETNKTSLEEHRLKQSMHYYLKTRACIDNPAHHALHEFDWTKRDLYAPSQMGEEAWQDPRSSHSSQGRGNHQYQIVLTPGDTQLSTRNAWLRSHETQPHWRSMQMYDLQRRSPGYVIEYRESQGSHKVYTDGSKMNREWGQWQSSTAISRMVRQPATNCPKTARQQHHLCCRDYSHHWHWTVAGIWAQFTAMK